MKNFIGEFKIEDLIIYTVIIGVLFYIGSYLNQQTEKVAEPYSIIYEGSINVNAPNTTLLRYDFASRALVTNTSRNNMSFMIGSILAILGGLIIIRRVRNETFNIGGESPGGVGFNLATNSPGLVISLLGVIIICFTIYFKDNYQIQDTGHYQQETQSGQAPTSTSSERDILMEDFNKTYGQ